MHVMISHTCVSGNYHTTCPVVMHHLYSHRPYESATSTECTVVAHMYSCILYKSATPPTADDESMSHIHHTVCTLHNMYFKYSYFACTQTLTYIALGALNPYGAFPSLLQVNSFV